MCVIVFLFIKLQALKENQMQVFSFEFSNEFKDTFSTEDILAIACGKRYTVSKTQSRHSYQVYRCKNSIQKLILHENLIFPSVAIDQLEYTLIKSLSDNIFSKIFSITFYIALIFLSTNFQVVVDLLFKKYLR